MQVACPSEAPKERDSPGASGCRRQFLVFLARRGSTPSGFHVASPLGRAGLKFPSLPRAPVTVHTSSQSHLQGHQFQGAQQLGLGREHMF